MKDIDNLDFEIGDFGDINMGIDFGDDSEGTPKPKKEEAEKVISVTLQSFKDRAKAEQKRFEKATDSEFWFCVCFQSREEKESFLKNSGLIDFGDKYLDGWDVAKTMGIAIEKDSSGYPKSNVDRKLSEFV